jgi:Zn-dependent peptidase ImmA (M78 family)
VRRGFKAEAERLALDERRELGLAATDRLDPHALAERYGIAIWPLVRLRAVIPDDVEHLLVVDAACFSAATVIRDEKVAVVYNEGHAPSRCANSITHELAHIILEHPPTNAFDAFGNRNYPKELEDEASWFAGCLLVPKDAVRPVMSGHGNDINRAAEHFGISVALMRWRVNATRWRHRP